MGQRIERLVDSDGNGSTDETNRYGLDGPHVWAVLDGSNNLGSRRLFGDSIDSPVVRVSSAGTVVWYLTDYQNSVTQLVNASGATLGTIIYDGFGKIVTDTTGANGDGFKYTGREWDATAQLQYNRARYYDPALGKWISMDPIGFDAGDANLYRYVGNGPTNATDPLGLKPPPPPFAKCSDILIRPSWNVFHLPKAAWPDPLLPSGLFWDDTEGKVHGTIPSVLTIGLFGRDKKEACANLVKWINATLRSLQTRSSEMRAYAENFGKYHACLVRNGVTNPYADPRFLFENAQQIGHIARFGLENRFLDKLRSLLWKECMNRPGGAPDEAPIISDPVPIIVVATAFATSQTAVVSVTICACRTIINIVTTAPSPGSVPVTSPPVPVP